MHMLSIISSVVVAAASIHSQPAGRHHATVKLIPETLSITPGSTMRVYADFKIDDHWHLYWDGLNDTGQPPRFTWKLPTGWTISEPEFPAPHRNVQPGGIVDYIYENRLALAFTLTAPTTVETKSAKIAADVEWLECADTCMFGAAKVETTIAIDTSEPKPNPAAKPVLEGLRATQVLPFDDAKGATIALEKETAAITVPGALKLEYFPGVGSSVPKEAASGTATNGETLKVQFTTKDERPVVNGIIAVYRTKQGPPAYYWTKAKEPAAATEPAVKPIKKDK